MKRWYDNWDAITPIFKFSPDVGKVIYTTNAIESLNSTYRKLNRQGSVFPSDTALLKALYLATFEATKARAGSAKLELPTFDIYIRHDFGHVKSRRQKRPSHHAYRFCYSGSRPSYIMLSSL